MNHKRKFMPKKPTPVKEYPIAEVVWKDAEEKGETGWNDLKEILAYAKKPCPIMKSVGYVVYKDSDHVSLLTTIGPDECSSIEKIPMSFVERSTELTPERNNNATI